MVSQPEMKKILSFAVVRAAVEAGNPWSNAPSDAKILEIRLCIWAEYSGACFPFIRSFLLNTFISHAKSKLPGRVAQSVGHLTRKSGVLVSIPGLSTYFRFSFRFFKKGSCQLLAKVCARSTG